MSDKQDEMKRAMRFMQIEAENQRLNSEIKRAKTTMGGILADFDRVKHYKYTGLNVCIKMKDGLPSEAFILDPDDERWENGEDFPAWDVILPIPTAESLPEFTGF